MNKIILPILAFIMIISTENVKASETTCPTMDKPKINLIFHPSDYRIDHTKTTKEIASKIALPSKFHEMTTIGVTTSAVNFDTNAHFQMGNMTNGEFCLYPTEITINVYQIDTTVYISNKYKKNSCQYNEILQHELIHVGIFNQFNPKLINTIKDIHTNVNGKIDGLNENQAIDFFLEDIHIQIKDQLKVIMKERNKLHIQLDSKKEYLRVTNSCNKEW